MSAEREQSTDVVRKPMPMCGDCHRPLGLFYAECASCLHCAYLSDTYYYEWCDWQSSQPRNTPVQSPGGAA